MAGLIVALGETVWLGLHGFSRQLFHQVLIRGAHSGAFSKSVAMPDAQQSRWGLENIWKPPEFPKSAGSSSFSQSIVDLGHVNSPLSPAEAVCNSRERRVGGLDSGRSGDPSGCTQLIWDPMAVGETCMFFLTGYHYLCAVWDQKNIFNPHLYPIGFLLAYIVISTRG